MPILRLIFFVFLVCLATSAQAGIHRSTIWGYDAAGQVTWELKGASGTGCVTTQPAGATVFSYDALGRKTQENEPGTADDVTYAYADHLNLTSVSTPTATWTYSYNKRRPTARTVALKLEAEPIRFLEIRITLFLRVREAMPQLITRNTYVKRATNPQVHERNLR